MVTVCRRSDVVNTKEDCDEFCMGSKIHWPGVVMRSKIVEFGYGQRNLNRCNLTSILRIKVCRVPHPRVHCHVWLQQARE